MSRLLSWSLAGVGVIALIAAAALRFVLVPAQSQLPADTDAHRTFVGTVDVMLDETAWNTGDFANILRTDIPVVIEADVAVTGVDGGVAEVAQDVTVTATSGEVLSTTTDTFAVDRRSMQAVGDREGLLIGWPIGAAPRDTVVWSTDLQAPIEATFEGTEQHAGLTTHRFVAQARGPIADPAVLDRLPAGVPKDALPAIIAELDLPDTVTSGLAAFLADAPDEIPLAFSADLDLTWWVDPATGDVVDIARTERRLVAADLAGAPAIPFADVFSMTFVGEEASVAAAVADARANGAALQRWSTTIPAALLLGGLAAVLASRYVGRRRHTDMMLELPDMVRA